MKVNFEYKPYIYHNLTVLHWYSLWNHTILLYFCIFERKIDWSSTREYHFRVTSRVEYQMQVEVRVRVESSIKKMWSIESSSRVIEYSASP